MKSAIFINLARSVCVSAAICCTVPLCAQMMAGSADNLKSQLATGRWVKISVAADGVYELTDEELREMGFNNPSNVQIYGQGGHAISEYLDGLAIDDLQQVSAARYNGKLCFYGQGPTAVKLSDPTTTTPHYTHTNNPYSNVGCYFLTENSAPKAITVQDFTGSRGSVNRPTSLGYFLHEQDKFNVGYSGKIFLGETIGSDGFKVNYNLPGIADSTITVHVAAAVNSDGTSYVESDAIAGGQTNKISYTLSKSRVLSTSTSRSLLYYNYANPYAAVNTHGIYPEGQVNVRINCPLNTVSFAYLDYCMITYSQHNTIVNSNTHQLNMGFQKLTANDCILLPDASANTIVWNIDKPAAPVQHVIAKSSAIAGYEFSPHKSASSSCFVAFDPQGTLLKISGYETVGNQNLHAMEVPDMLIITNQYFMPEANRLAQLHRDNDHMSVAVVDHEQIFNEFSSGTRDAMAYRLLCKMLYDRDRTKFKYLMLFGPGSYDNRGISSKKDNLLLTYQSDNSNDQDNTYTSDDFFGLLDNKSGNASTIYSDALRLGVGRYPAATIEEAKADVDKLIKYVNNPDYGPWRRNALVISDAGDNDIHVFQAEGVSHLIDTISSTDMNVNKVYVDMFQQTNETSLDARKRMNEYLQSGQFFVTYIGHGSPTSITRSNLWTSQLAQSTTYSHLPIMSTAACEVARYDSDERGIAEHWFHKTDGGAIALLCTTRVTLSDQNDILNTSFIKNLFSEPTDGQPLRLGDVYKKAKQSFGSAYNGNKMAYTLLGDPALIVSYPKPKFQITNIASNDMASDTVVTTGPLQRLTITAQVVNNDGTPNNTYNGDVTLTLYDTERLFMTTTQAMLFETIKRDIYYPRDVLSQVEGKVVNGQFVGTIIVPRFSKAYNEQIEVGVFAHDNAGNMVSGSSDKLVMGGYNEELAITDDNAPVIEYMYLNSEESFIEGDVAPSNSILHIKASDDLAINTQSASVGNRMKLILDGGKSSYYNINTYATTTNSGRDMEISFPVDGLTQGQHTLSFTVFDVAGNSASRTISFGIRNNKQIEILTDNKPVIDHVTFELRNNNFLTKPDVTLKVVNAQGDLVWSTSHASFPVTWDLHDKQGNKVKPGLYKYYSNFGDGNDFGGTAMQQLIVIDPVAKN